MAAADGAGSFRCATVRREFRALALLSSRCHQLGLAAPIGHPALQPRPGMGRPIDSQLSKHMVGQRTLRTSIRATGVGLHSGTKVLMTVRPAAADTGIVFSRTDLAGSALIPARAENVGETMLG